MSGIQIIPNEELPELLKFTQPPNKHFGEGGYKKAYQYNDTTVLTLEQLHPGSTVQKPFAQYKEELDTMYKLDASLIKNLLLPTHLGEDDKNHRFLKMPLCRKNNMSDLNDYMQDEGGILNEDPKKIYPNLAEILETIYELHKLNISCMDIKMENTFVNCGPEKNLFVLGDTDGFTVHKSKVDMYENSRCVSTPGFFITGKKGKVVNSKMNKLGGPNTDWYAFLMVTLLVYYRINLKDRQWMQVYDDNYVLRYGEQYNSRYGKKHKKFEEVCKSLQRPDGDEVVDIITKALVACGKEVLYEKSHKGRKATKILGKTIRKGKEDVVARYDWNSPDGTENFYKDFILPVIEKLKALEGGRKTRRRRRKRTKKKRRRKRTKKRRKSRKRRRRRR